MIYVIGASNVDFIVKAREKIVEGESNLAKISLDFGGVGRNIAENLSNLDANLKFVTALGDDFLSTLVKNDLTQKGIDFNLSVDTNANQSSYLSILDLDGELKEGYNDMRALEFADIEEFNPVLNQIVKDDILVLDTNFSVNILRHLVKKTNCYKVIDATSAIKCLRISNFLNLIDLVKFNKNEAETFSGVKINDESDFLECFKILRLKGAKDVIITHKEGLYFLKKNTVFSYRHNATIEAVNVTGAGDALISGVIKCLSEKQDFDYMVKFALAMALITLKSNKAIANYDINTIKDLILNSNIKGEIIYEFKN